VITVLTNRAYMGEIFFRGRYHPAPHPRLVDAEMFETAQAILESRGEDMALRRTNGSDYLLTGLLVCEKCGKRFIGGSAQGNVYRYAYHVCFSRHRYGTQECDQDRLRADELETRVVESLLSTLGRRDLLEDAVERWGEIVETSRLDAALLVSVILGAVAFFALFAREDPVCWARNPTTGESFRLDPDRFVHGSSISINSRDLPPGATESGCSSDSISTNEAIAGIAVVAAMVGAAWVLSKPVPPRVTPATSMG